jgi:hypothetical protein
VQVVAVRVSGLPAAVELPEVRRYAGCVSWVELDSDVDVSRASPVIDDARFTQRLARMRTALGEAAA